MFQEKILNDKNIKQVNNDLNGQKRWTTIEEISCYPKLDEAILQLENNKVSKQFDNASDLMQALNV